MPINFVKRRVAFAAVLLMCCMPVTEASIASEAPVQRASADANLLVNGDFASALPTGWRVQQHNGVESVVVTDGVLRMLPTGWVSQAFNTTPSQTYTFTGWIRMNQQFEAAPGTGVVVLAHTADGSDNPVNYLGNSAFYSAPNWPIGAWVKSSFAFTATTARTVLTYRVFYDINAGRVDSQFSVDADNFVVSTTPETVPQPSAPAPATCSSFNLIQNGDFSNQFTAVGGWGALAGDGVTATPVISNGQLLINPDAWLTQVFTVTPSTRYYVSGDVRVTSQISVTGFSGLIFLVNNVDNTVGIQASSIISTVTPEFRRIYFTFQSPASAEAQIPLRLNFRALNGAKLTAEADRFAVSKCPIPSSGVIGSQVRLPMVVR